MSSLGWSGAARTKVHILGRPVPLPLIVGSVVFVVFIVLHGWIPLFPSPGPRNGGYDSSSEDKTLYGLSRTSSPLLVRPDEYVAAPERFLRLPQLGEMPAPLKPKKEGMRVPNAVHYIYGLKPQEGDGEEGPELPYYAYLAVRSAMVNLKPEKVYFHYERKPHGPWWDLLEPHLTLLKTTAPTQIFGNRVDHFAHKADIMRLFAIKGMGGIYLDIDVFVIRPFDDLLYYPTTMGMEAHPDDDRRWTLDVEGLCNAVIVSEPNAPFIDRWIQRYVNFDDNEWAEHSVRLPWVLARQNAEEVQVLNPTAFFSPLWKPEEVKMVHETTDYDFHKTGQYAYHAWESMSMDYLRKLAPWSIRDEETSFHRMVRPFIGPDDDDVYRRWKKKEE